MAFANLTTLYLPVAGSAGTSQWGTDVRKLLDAADATGDSTTVTDHGTGAANTRTADPYTTTTTDGVEANFGWAVTPTDMGSVAGALRFFPAGNHVYTGRMSSNSTLGVTGTLSMFVYRVGTAAASRARTLLGSASASVMLPAVSGEVTATVTVNLAEIILAADETIQYSWEFNLAGVAITGRVARFITGTQTSVAARVDTPGLRTLADTTGTATGTGSATGVTGNVLGTIGTATGLGTATGVLGATAATTGTAAGSSTVDGAGSSVAGTIGTATGSATTTGVGGKVLGTIGTVTIGGGGTPDYPVTTPTKAIAGTVIHHETAVPVVGATVRLYRVSDDLMCQTTTSAAGGAYSFVRDAADPNTYYTTATYLDGATQVHGISDRGLVPA